MGRYGWIPDVPDHRDQLLALPPSMLVALPKAVDLRPQCPPVYDQGALGSCTAQAIAAAIEFNQVKQGQTPSTPSRLFIYYNERVLEGSVHSDAGAMLRDGIKSVVKQGACTERAWPYDIARFTERPPRSCYTDALEHQVLRYQRVRRSLTQMQGVLAAGYPFVFGFSVYESFESAAVARTGEAPMPDLDERLLGGHAVDAVGYDPDGWLCRNSWGPDWGDGGYFRLPYAYLLSDELSDDFWVIQAIE